MIHRYRRLWLLVSVVASLLVLPTSALAAVETDAVLTVKFIDAVTLLPVDGAAIHVKASQGETVLAELDASTDATGVAIVTGLPRETGEGDPVVVDVTAHKATVFTDEETGCIFGESWDAMRVGVVVDSAAIAVEFNADEQSPGSSIQCPPDEVPPSQEVEGAVGTPAAARTLPPTDALGEGTGGLSGGVAVAIGVLSLAAGILFLTPRRRLSPRRERSRR